MCVFTILIELFSTWHLLLFWTKPVQLSSTERLLQSWQIQWGYCINLLGRIQNQNLKHVFDQGLCSAEDKKHLGWHWPSQYWGFRQNFTEIQDKFCEKYGPIITTGCSLGTVNCNVPFNFYLFLILVSFLLFLLSIYREVLLLSGKTCDKFNHNCAKARAFH